MMTVVDRLDLLSQEAAVGWDSVSGFGPGLPLQQPGQGE